MARRNKSAETKTKILEAAARIISQKGYPSTTVAEICDGAGANIAAVNYHFGDKKNLYIETWKYAFHHAITTHPPDGGVPRDADFPERLKGWVVSTLRRITDPDCFDFEITHAELTHPTGFLTEVISANAHKMFNPLENLVKEYLGGIADEQDIQLCAMSIHAQCMNPMVFSLRKNHVLPIPMPVRPGIDKIVDHVMQFSLGGLERAKWEIIHSESGGGDQAAALNITI